MSRRGLRRRRRSRRRRRRRRKRRRRKRRNLHLQPVRGCDEKECLQRGTKCGWSRGLHHPHGRILRRMGRVRMTRFEQRRRWAEVLVVTLLAFPSVAGEPVANGTKSQVEWLRIPLDSTGRSLGKLRTAFSSAMRDEKHFRNMDKCMIAWAFRPPAKTDPTAFEGQLELRVEGTGGGAVVDSASVYQSNLRDAHVASCLARSFEGPIGVALPQGTRLRFLFPVSLHRRSLAFYRAKYPAPQPHPRE